MSHINSALKKAQKEKDSIYKRYGHITPATVGNKITFRKIGSIIAAAVALISLAAIVILIFENNIHYTKDKSTGGENIVAKQARIPKAETGKTEIEPADHMSTSNEKVEDLEAFEKAGLMKPGVDILYEKAQDWYQKSDFDGAFAGYEKVLTIEPDHPFALNNLGVIYMKRGGTETAEEMFRKAIDLKADYVDPYYNLACLYSLSGNISKSLYYLGMAASINNSVKNWAKDDKDLQNLRESAQFSEIFE